MRSTFKFFQEGKCGKKPNSPNHDHCVHDPDQRASKTDPCQVDLANVTECELKTAGQVTGGADLDSWRPLWGRSFT